MIRLIAVLCFGLFAVLLIAGEDKGQVRQGLMARTDATEAPAAAPARPAAPALAAEPVAAVSEAVFVPAQPVRNVPDPATPIPAMSDQAAADPAPPEAEGWFAVVAARAVNVRAGPSTAAPVVGRLTNGEEVLVVTVVDQPAIDGWSLVRIEGDGVTGYVASRLLQPLDP